MQPVRLDFETLEVTTFEVQSGPGPSFAVAGTYDTCDPAICCCTGCDSGCGLIPTAGGCESAGGADSEFVCGG